MSICSRPAVYTKVNVTAADAGYSAQLLLPGYCLLQFKQLIPLSWCPGCCCFPGACKIVVCARAAGIAIVSQAVNILLLLVLVLLLLEQLISILPEMLFKLNCSWRWQLLLFQLLRSPERINTSGLRLHC